MCRDPRDVCEAVDRGTPGGTDRDVHRNTATGPAGGMLREVPGRFGNFAFWHF